MNQREIHFSLKDTPLREDVSALGVLMGEVLEEQGGERLYYNVEMARTAAIRRRRGDSEAGEELSRIIEALSEEEVAEVIRAFSVYFQVVNLAEQVHRIRRRRDYIRIGTQVQPGSLDDTVQKLARSGQGLDAVKTLLEHMVIEPVFTAHPTEATRRSLLEKHLRIARCLVDRLDPSLTPAEDHAAMGKIRSEVATMWQTEEHPSARRSVADELEHVLFYITDILYRIVPAFYESLERALKQVYGVADANFRAPSIIRFASWVGGDMDGNPNVTSETIHSTLAQHRRLILALYQRELGQLYRQLSQSMSRISVSMDLRKQVSLYSKRFPEILNAIPPRHHDMPYRLLIRLIQERLEASGEDRADGYADADEFLGDLHRISASLRENKGVRAGQFSVNRLIRRVETFGFHLATLDIRQDAQVHRSVAGKLLGESEWASMPADRRTEILLRALESMDKPAGQSDDEAERTLEVFREIAASKVHMGPRAIGPYIVSMTQDVDDVLTVLLLAKWSGLAEDGTIPLDVAPLFETVSDLQRAPDVMSRLLSCDTYRSHLSSRGNRQVVMIGYSDSNKDSGFVSARWALQQAEGTLCGVTEQAGIDLTIFHGRGGTSSRGGGRIERSILAAPKGTVRGRLRVTEQGEIIHAKYGMRGIATRELEQMVGSVAISTVGAGPQHGGGSKLRSVMKSVAEVSRKAYRDLVYGNEGFYGYFRQATPIDVIERMQIGSRPASRRTQEGIENLRAIPWVFAWTQSRHMLPGWFGLGTGLAAAMDTDGEDTLVETIDDQPFFRSLIDDAEMVLAKADLDVAARYAALVGEAGKDIFERIKLEYDLTVGLILKLKGIDTLLDGEPTLQRSIELRNPYVDPISLIQVNLLRKWRASNRADRRLFGELLATINGIAEGLQNTG
jgi:phosphoenolpyruvate carboxylase